MYTDGKTIVRPGETHIWQRDDMPDDMKDIMDDLQLKLDEQNMVLSMLGAVNGISSDVYDIIRRDYRKAWTACNEVKKKVSRFVMEYFEAESGELSWKFAGLDNYSISIYVS